jgi:uncharacterized membrane protein
MNRRARLPMKAWRRHPRIWIALAVGALCCFLLPTRWSFVTRVLLGWDLGVTLFLVAIYLWMRSLTANQICLRYVEEDPSRSGHSGCFVLAAATLIDSWLLVPTMFTTHYADMFYSPPPADRPLSFPQTEMPVFWDFAYFSFTIAAANQTADVITTRVSIRKVIIAQEIISFVFNASILGFAINVTAGLIGN